MDNWLISNALASIDQHLRMLEELEKDEPTDDHMAGVRQGQRTALNYARSVIAGMGQIEPPVKLNWRDQLRQGRDRVTDGLADTLDNVAYWLRDLKHNRRGYWRGDWDD